MTREPSEEISSVNSTHLMGTQTHYYNLLCESQTDKQTNGLLYPWLPRAYSTAKGVYREEGMQLTMYPTYSSDFVSETGYAKNRIQ